MLNKQQQLCVDTIYGPVLSVACPGSGKTTTLIERVHHMIEMGIEPSSILVITFTKAAADEMGKRYNDKYGNSSVTFSTIHSLCYNILRKRYKFTYENILKANEAWSFFKEWLMNKGGFAYNELEDLIKSINTELSCIRNSEANLEEYETESLKHEDFISLFHDYSEFKKKNKKIDFDDMLIRARDLLVSSEEETLFWANKFDFIMIDEFQDTNKLQAQVIFRIADYGHKNILVCGDDDQSLYKFRAADNKIFTDFPKRYPDCKEIRLTTNYRSLPQIIEKAGKLIERNNERYEKDFLASRDGQAAISVTKTGNDKDQAEIVIDKIKELHEKGIAYDDIAVLYRNNILNQFLVGKLMKTDIAFFTTEPPKDFHKDFIFEDIKAYYRLAHKKQLKGDILKILNKPTRYLKKQYFKNAETVEDLKDALHKINDESAIGRSIIEINKMRSDIKTLSTKTKPAEFVSYIAFNMEYYDWLRSYADFVGRDVTILQNILSQLLKEAEDFDTMEEWFQYAEEYSNALMIKQKEKKEGVCLSTFHSSKGLEWKAVIIINADKKVTPFVPERGEVDIEEERRCFYVAMTRAKDELHIYYTGIASQFLDEADLEYSNRQTDRQKRLKKEQSLMKQEKNKITGFFEDEDNVENPDAENKPKLQAFVKKDNLLIKYEMQ